MSAIQRTLRIRPGETRLVVPMVVLSFVGMAGLAMGQSGANALFFDRIGTDALPLMYLVQGGTAFVFMLGLAAVLGRVDRRRVYLAIPAGLGAVVLAERVALLVGGRWIFPVLWLTVAIAILLQNVFVWGIAGVVTDTRRAKRLFPLFAAGEILGSVTGGLLTDPLVGLIGTENLFLAWALALATSFALCRVVLSAAGTDAQPRVRRARRSTSPIRDLTVAFGYVTRSRLLVWMTLAAVLFSVLFFSLYLPWATAATERFHDADALAGFFGLFWAAMTGAAFLVSVLLTNRLFGRFGIATMMMALPLLYVGSFGILLASSGFVTLVVLRFVDGVWLQGVASPAWETLTNVIPDARRDQVRTFLNGGPAQAGTVIAGVIALVGQDVLSPRQFAAIGLATAAIAVFVTWRVRASYASALVDALREGRPEVFPDVAVAGVPFAFDRDAQTTRSLLDAAQDEHAPVRRLAVQLLADVDDERAKRSLERALRDADPTVRAQAVVALAPRLGKDRATRGAPAAGGRPGSDRGGLGGVGDRWRAERLRLGRAARDARRGRRPARSNGDTPLPGDRTRRGGRTARSSGAERRGPGRPCRRAEDPRRRRRRRGAGTGAPSARGPEPEGARRGRRGDGARRRSRGGLRAGVLGAACRAGCGPANAGAARSRGAGGSGSNVRRRARDRGGRRSPSGGRRPVRSGRGRAPARRPPRASAIERTVGAASALVDLDRRGRRTLRDREASTLGTPVRSRTPSRRSRRPPTARSPVRSWRSGSPPNARSRWGPTSGGMTGWNGRWQTMMRSSRRAPKP